MAYETFDTDLLYGKAREDACVRQLLSTKLEHKADRKALRTGNVAIEFECRWPDGRVGPSGVTITTAETWVTEFGPDRRIFVPTTFAKQLAGAAAKAGKTKWVGDGGNHHCALVPFGWFLTGPTDA